MSSWWNSLGNYIIWYYFLLNLWKDDCFLGFPVHAFRWFNRSYTNHLAICFEIPCSRPSLSRSLCVMCIRIVSSTLLESQSPQCQTIISCFWIILELASLTPFLFILFYFLVLWIYYVSIIEGFLFPKLFWLVGKREIREELFRVPAMKDYEVTLIFVFVYLAFKVALIFNSSMYEFWIVYILALQ